MFVLHIMPVHDKDIGTLFGTAMNLTVTMINIHNIGTSISTYRWKRAPQFSHKLFSLIGIYNINM